ncbi:uncharacterized protein KIAA1755 homolog isoform X2 [Geospiza fortis]|uniref:Uncharacterized protein KIAA1755 homolog isoform X2 n=1 Tax=Geospiza fortis TaxID=48883 RepID=A0A8N5EKV9_GEOFO|nr:uncharacterized protein KIAA1755 homolog isoform X2 [Geospiza fortis]
MRCVLPPSQAPYFNRIFLHEGWPLCLHEKVVVHLAPLNPLLLRPGDFYLQAEPCEEHTARVTIKHLSLDLRSVEETPVPEATHALLFTNAWLEEVNSSWAGAPLHTCLVATENGVTPLPWSRIATPEFTDKPRAGGDSVPADAWHEPAPETAPGTLVLHGTVNVPTPYSNVVGTIPGCKATSRKSSQGRYPGLIKVEQAGLRKKPATLAVPSLSEIISQNLEGEYVDLLEQSQEDLDVLTRSLLPTCLPGRIRAEADEMLPWANGGSGADSWPCGGALSSEESPCSPCLGRQISQEPGSHGPKCRQRDSYMAALQNPGTRLGAAPEDERVSSQHEGAWKKMSAIYSPRMGRARAAGKGTNAATAAPVEERSLESSNCKNGPSMPSTGTAGREPPAWQDLHAGLLRSGIICLPGSSDRLGRALLLVTTSGSAWRAAWCSAAELARLILCLGSLPRQEVKNGERREAKDAGLTVVVDARKQPPAPVLFSALRSVQSVSPGCIHSMLLLAEKELVSREKLSGVQVETLTSLKALGRHVDSSQLPPELDGAFPYCHGEWVQFFQKLQPFTASLRRASELLQRCIQELRNTNALAGTQDAAAGIRRHQELMQKVLSDAQLARVQREGGFLLARLRREAARLCASDHIRTGMELAEGLYSQLEEELHSLVSQSNSCLARLQFLRKVRELETQFSKLGSWLDGEAAARLQEMGTEDWSPDSCQGSAEHFKEFLTQATARYQHGLTLCQEAAEVRGRTFPEADALQVSAALFQTKLMSFSQQLERRQAEQELLQELVRFSNKVAGLKLDCRQCSARAQRGEGQALRCLQRSFQKLSVEFALEKLKEMKAQVRRMQSSQGLAAWTEAQHKYQETRQILEEMLAELQEAWGAQADGQGDSSSPPSPGSAAPHVEVLVCRAAPSPEPAALGGRGLAEQPEASTEGPGQPQGPGQSQPSTTPGSTLGVEQSSLQPHCQLGPQDAHTSHHHISADTPHPKPKSKASLGVTGHLSQERSQPRRRRPVTLPPWTRFPGADPPCPTAVPPGTAPDPSTAGAPAGPQAEAAQYFQISSQSSFSSEDSDSQNSMEEAPAASLALPGDLQSPRPPCPSEKAHQIIYLENHHTESSAKANAK